MQSQENLIRNFCSWLIHDRKSLSERMNKVSRWIIRINPSVNYVVSSNWISYPNVIQSTFGRCNLEDIPWIFAHEVAHLESSPEQFLHMENFGMPRDDCQINNQSLIELGSKECFDIEKIAIQYGSIHIAPYLPEDMSHKLQNFKI